MGLLQLHCLYSNTYGAAPILLLHPLLSVHILLSIHLLQYTPLLLRAHAHLCRHSYLNFFISSMWLFAVSCLLALTKSHTCTSNTVMCTYICVRSVVASACSLAVLLQLPSGD